MSRGNREEELRRRSEQRNRERGCFMSSWDRMEYDRRNWEMFDLQLLDFAEQLEEALEKALKDSGRSTALEQQVRDLQDQVDELTAGIKAATAVIEANSQKLEDALKG